MQTRELSEKNDENERSPVKNDRTGEFSGENGAPLNHEEILIMSSQTIRGLHKRVSGTRFKVQKADAAKLAHVRAFVAILTVYSGILKDFEINCLEERIRLLEAGVEKNDDR